MRSVKIGLTKTAQIYDSIKELNIERYQEFQKNVVQDLGIGSDMASVASHFSTLHSLIGADKKDKAMREAINLHNNFYCMIEKIDIRSYCFAIMVHSINGKERSDYSDEGIKQTLELIKDVKAKEVEETLFEVKKNLVQSFNPSFLESIQTTQA